MGKIIDREIVTWIDSDGERLYSMAGEHPISPILVDDINGAVYREAGGVLTGFVRNQQVNLFTREDF